MSWFFGPNGAHVRLPGFLYQRNTRVTDEWADGKSWRLLGLVSLIWIDPNPSLRRCGKPGFSVTFATFKFRMTKAVNHAW